MIMIDFTNINYLKEGNKRQQLAYQELSNLNIMKNLVAYQPLLAGTIPIDIDLPESDLDIICTCEDPIAFAQLLTQLYENQTEFTVYTQDQNGLLSTLAQFKGAHFEIEVFGQNKPSQEQNAFRHMLVEHYLLEKHGNEFKEKIKQLKASGLKTEPAFAKLLGIEGDPYEALLGIEIPEKTEDKRDILKEESPFSYKLIKGEKALIYFNGKMIKTAKGKEYLRLQQVIKTGSDYDVQMCLAKMTRNFKRGNERK